MERYINKSTLYTLNKDTCPRRSFLRKWQGICQDKGWEAPVSRKILIGVDWAESLFSDTKPSDKNGS